ncbi:MAG TPA: hypothetical protein VF766_02570 [Pyrinomonadaceae bacterium]
MSVDRQLAKELHHRSLPLVNPDLLFSFIPSVFDLECLRLAII